MERKIQAFEEALRKSMEKSELSPSPDVLSKLKFRLRVSDFFGFNPGKVNIYYTVILIGTLTGAILINRSNTTEEETGFAISKTEAEAAVNKEKDQVSESKTESSEIALVSETPRLIADFEAEVIRGCAPLKVKFSNKSSLADKNEWDFGTGEISAAVNPEYIYKNEGIYKAVLTVSNETGDIATFKRTIEVLSPPVADFEIDIEKSDILKREILFKNKSVGASKYTWQFGDNHKSISGEPVHAYADFDVYQVQLIAIAQNGCSDSVTIINKFIKRNYSLSFPLNFRPHPFGNGQNGYYENAGSNASIFYPKNFGATDYKLVILAPNGIEVFSTNKIKQGWNGYIGGRLSPRGIYYYEASGIYPNGQSFLQKGKFKVLVEDYY